MYPQYTTTAPYQQGYSPSPPQTDSQGWWYTSHPSVMSPPQQFDVGSYQTSYPSPYTMHPQVDHYQAASSPPMSPVASPTYVRLISPATVEASSEATGKSKKPLIRRSYHPNPPAHRSEWVMWAGNVPSDAAQDELWRFFTSFPAPTSEVANTSGVLSIFLISRSSCAFVNYEAEHYLVQAIEHFNGQPLHPGDAKCPKLVCRIRKKDDDLKAGVGGQRGFGMHLRWIQEQKARAAEGKDVLPSSDVSEDSDTSIIFQPEISSLSISSNDDPSHQRPRLSSSGSGSGSYTSTNSSLLMRFFPQRYFILKSLSQSDLDLSTEKGLWATQKHNEGILDQAYRTSQDVFLIFSVNKSGEFYGYARMCGPIRRGAHKVSWATRASDSASSGSPLPLSAGRADNKGRSPDSAGQLQGSQNNIFFSPSADRFVDNSPLPQAEQKQESGPTGFPNVGAKNVQSAPAELGAAHDRITLRAPMMKFSFDQSAVNKMQAAQAPEDEEFKLDPSAPVRAIRAGSGPAETSIPTLEMVAEEDGGKGGEDGGHGTDVRKGDGGERDEWGESFKIEWLSTEKISFQKTRHIRNPWNHDREVKVSRDGTELEPGVGRRLLDEWVQLASKQLPIQPAAKAHAKRGSRPTGSLLAAGSEM
ncbi:hypothetical protein C0991_008547 [Blastosporella zonata]|nr:hypothetical protein C0991_008547 [Blastosporella zonata]